MKPKKAKLFEPQNSKRVLRNPKVVIFSILALGFLALTFLVDWIFIIGAVILMILNQRELLKK